MNKGKGNRKEHTEEEMKQLLSKKYTPLTTHIFNGNEYIAVLDGTLHKTVKQSKEIQREVKATHKVNDNMKYELVEEKDNEGNIKQILRHWRLDDNGVSVRKFKTSDRELPFSKIEIPDNKKEVTELAKFLQKEFE